VSSAVSPRLGGRERPMASGRSGLVAVFVCAAAATDLNVSFASGLEGRLLANAATFLWLGATGAYLALTFGRGDRAGPRTRLLGHDRAYIGWLGLVSASMLWSVSASASFKAMVPLAVVWFAALLLCTVPAADVVRAVLVVACVVAVLSLALVAIDTQLAYQPISSTGGDELRGVFRHQLRLGAFMALALGLLVIARLKGDIERVRTKSTLVNGSVIVLLAGVLLMSRSRTYGAAAAVALVLTLLLSRRGRRKWVVLIVGVIVVLAVVNQFDALWIGLQDAGFDTTLTGRTNIWNRTLSGVTQKSRWLGHGFGTLKLPTFDYLFPMYYRPGHAHSSYIQAYFETGIVGLMALIGLVVVQLVVAWRHSVRCNTFSYGLFLVLFTAIGSLTGLNYAGTLSAMFSLMMLFLAIESRETPAAGVPQDAGTGSGESSGDVRDPIPGPVAVPRRQPARLHRASW
jgi:exopolysaccharide production protein ExoQ